MEAYPKMVVYTTMAQVMSEEDYPIINVFEDNQYYYVRKPHDYYDDFIWMIDKRNGEVSGMPFTGFFAIEDQTTRLERPYNLKIGGAA